jgi:hypothetical protein
MIKIIRKLTLIPYTFVLMNWAAVAGLYYFIQGSAGIWNSVRPHSSAGVWNTARN